MSWIIWVVLFLFLIFVLIFWILNRSKIKRLLGVGTYIISAPPRTGKSALACCLAQKARGRVVSPFPIKIKNSFSYKISYSDILNFNTYKSDYCFLENDLVILDELALVLNSNDLEKQFKRKQESLGMFCKLVGHLFNGTIFLIEQHPNRIPIQAREKAEVFIQVVKMRKFLIFVGFKLRVYHDLEDYNKVVFSKWKSKKMMKKGIALPSYKAEVSAFSVWFNKSYLSRYNSRALYYIHQIKLQLSQKVSYSKFSDLDLNSDDLKEIGIDKIKDFI